MAEIGSKLRETRIRNKIDITTVEQATKIRAKYLRALENEEWRVLPGPTYVKTFLRSYADFLGLDARILLEEFSARYEEPEELELPAFTREGRLRGRVRHASPPSRWTFVLGFLVAFIGFLFVLGLTGGDEKGARNTGKSSTKARPRGPVSPAAPAPTAARRKRKRAGATSVRIELVAARPVWVCLVDASGRARIDGVVVGGAERRGPFRSSSFKVTIGNGGGDLRINGRRRDTPERSEPIGYLVKPSGTSVLSAAQRPTCG